jgi:predicted Zn finger-like uncharacterized protein
MYTQCPGCLTLFHIRRSHLHAAGGVVRCGLCNEAFNALNGLCRELPQGLPVDPRELARLLREAERDAEDDDAPVALQAEPSAGATAPAPAPVSGGDEGPLESETLPDSPATEESGAGDSAEAEPVLRAAEPGHDGVATDWHLATALEVESTARERQTRRRSWLWGLGIVVACVALALQLVWFKREDLAQMSAWRPWVARLCSLAGCRLPPLHKPSAVGVAERALVAAPGGQGDLVFTATIVNRAEQSVAWPQLGLTLRRLNGTVAWNRWFAAGEYLARARPGEGGMEPGRRYAVRLVLPDPGAGADNFEVDFR